MRKISCLLLAVLLLTGCAITRDVKYQLQFSKCKTPYGSGENCTLTIEKYLDVCPYKDGCGEYQVADPAGEIEITPEAIPDSNI